MRSWRIVASVVESKDLPKEQPLELVFRQTRIQNVIQNGEKNSPCEIKSSNLQVRLLTC